VLGIENKTERGGICASVDKKINRLTPKIQVYNGTNPVRRTAHFV